MSEQPKIKVNGLVIGFAALVLVVGAIYFFSANGNCASAQQRTESLGREYKSWLSSSGSLVNANTYLKGLDVNVSNALDELGSTSCPNNDDITAARQTFSTLHTETAKVAQDIQDKQNTGTGSNQTGSSGTTTTSSTGQTTTANTTPSNNTSTQPPTTYEPPTEPKPEPKAGPERISLSGYQVVLQYCDRDLEYISASSQGFRIPSYAQSNAVIQIMRGNEWASIYSQDPTSDGLRTKRTSCMENQDAYDIAFSGSGSGRPIQIAWGNSWAEVHRSGDYIYLTTLSE